MKFEKVEFKHLLASVLKPTRYIDHEINSYHKTPSETTVNFCLAFPDVYEVGFSHLGIKILYTILNQEDDTVADRVYTPWPDFGNLIQKEKIPLFGVESQISISDFDVIGFTLQSELTYTNILYTLELGNVPLRSSERSDEDPIVIGGGPCVTNPEALSIFFDAFLIGDGEEAIIEMKNAVKATKNLTRLKKLEALAAIEGVYVPQLHDGKSIVKIRKFMAFEDESKKHHDQMVPWLMPTHYRYVTEIMRGCTRGCRFCHAGMYYRPVRERDPEKVVEEIIHEVEKYGWEEVALSSLSSSDYTCIKSVLFALFEKLKNKQASLSLPSLRVDSIDDDFSKLLNAMRQKGLTIAPEAGSQRLRNIINKDITEKDIMDSVEMAIRNGWKLIKMYFMIGLPFEEMEDIQAIIDMVEKIIQLSGRRIQLNITLSPYVPKPFTPFQWSTMDNDSSLKQKATIVKNHFKNMRFVKVSYHEVDASKLEAMICRGDAKVGEVILEAFKNGAKFDGWMEYFNTHIWHEALEKTGTDIDYYLKGRELHDKLIWDHIDLGITKNFLKDEWNKASKEEITPDCREGECSLCGICVDEVQPLHCKEIEVGSFEYTRPEPDSQAKVYFYRVFYGKMEDMRFVAHLDLIRMMQTVMRSSGLPIAYSQGYSVHPKLSFGPPLSIGVEGEHEYFDAGFTEEVDPEIIMEKLKGSFPKSLQLQSVAPFFLKKDRAMEYYPFEEQKVYPEPGMAESFKQKVEEFNVASEFKFTRIRKKREKVTDLKEIVKLIEWKDDHLHVIKRVQGASIFDILEHVFGIHRDNTNRFRVIRKNLIHELKK